MAFGPSGVEIYSPGQQPDQLSYNFGTNGVAANTTMTLNERIQEILGVRNVRKRPVAAIRAGLPTKVLINVVRYYDLDARQTQDISGFALKTLQRRARGSLSKVQSDRVYRLARVGAQAEEVLGKAGGRAWMRTANRALEGDKPIDLLDTDAGATAVSEIIQRIDHGVFS